MALGASLLDQANDALRASDKLLPICDFRNNVVVVGIKPLSHFQRCALRVAARQREFLIKRNLSRVPTDSTDGQGSFEHLVVVSHVRGDGVILVQAQILQAGISIHAQRMRCGFKGFLVNLASPEGLERLFQFALWANAWVALDGGFGKWSCLVGHVLSLIFDGVIGKNANRGE